MLTLFIILYGFLTLFCLGTAIGRGGLRRAIQGTQGSLASARPSPCSRCGKTWRYCGCFPPKGGELSKLEQTLGLDNHNFPGLDAIAGRYMKGELSTDGLIARVDGYDPAMDYAAAITTDEKAAVLQRRRQSPKAGVDYPCGQCERAIAYGSFAPARVVCTGKCQSADNALDTSVGYR